MRGRIAVALLALVACGSPDSAPQGRPPPELLYDQALPVARAGVLKVADLPGYKATKSDKYESLLGHDFDTCLDADALGASEVVEQDGSYEKGLTQLISVATVVRSSESAKQFVAAMRKPSTTPCFEKVTTYYAATAGMSASRFSGRTVPLSVPGADETFALQFTQRLAFEGTTIRLDGRWVTAVTGPAVVDVLGFVINNAAPSLATMRTLLAKATRRAKAARAKA